MTLWTFWSEVWWREPVGVELNRFLIVSLKVRLTQLIHSIQYFKYVKNTTFLCEFMHGDVVHFLVGGVMSRNLFGVDWVIF